MPSWEKLQCSRKCYFFRFLHVCLCQNCLKYLENYRASLRFFNFSPMWQQRHIYTGKPWQLLQYIWQFLSPRAIYLMTYIKEQGKDDPCGEEREPLNGQPWAELGEREKADHCRNWDIADREQPRNCRVQLSRGSADEAKWSLAAYSRLSSYQVFARSVRLARVRKIGAFFHQRIHFFGFI